MEFADLFSPDTTAVKGPYSGLSANSDTVHFPTLYSLSDALPTLADSVASGDPRLLLGVNGQGDPLFLDLEDESPHVMVSAATGGGKSAILRSLASQALAHGDQVVILDLKRHSHMWAEGLPNVYIARTLPEIGNALVSTGQEVHRRNDAAEQWLRAQQRAGNWSANITDAPVGQRTIILFEEMNATFEQLTELTRRVFRNVETYTATDGLKDVMFMGRAARIHVAAVGQYMEARAMGGSAVRVNFGTRILIRHDKNTWNMLAWDAGLPKAAPEEIGRGFTIRAGKARMTQYLYMSDQEARTYAETAIRANTRGLPAAHSTTTRNTWGQ
jgi:hypothetical protein